MLNPENVLSFWLGTVDEMGQVDDAHRARWFKKDPALDAAIRDRFTVVYDAVVRGDCDGWLKSPRGRLAFIIVLDQFSRNMFRGSPKSFACDEHALAVALDGISHGDDRAVPAGARGFFYLPLMHAEDLEMQERAVALYQEANNEEGLKFARAHRDVIRRFGRFPGRNQALGRLSTETEVLFLAQPGSSF